MIQKIKNKVSMFWFIKQPVATPVTVGNINKVEHREVLVRIRTKVGFRFM